MPKQVLPTREEFHAFATKLIRLGFRSFLFERPLQSPREGEPTIKIPKVPARKRGRELGFFFKSKVRENQYVVVVWTTWLIREQRARDQDAGWVLITGNKKRLYVKEARRTKYFLDRLYQRAEIARTRVIGRPICPECCELMGIKFGRALGQRYWLCDNRNKHSDRKPRALSWDIALNDEQKKFVAASRRSRERYKKRVEKEGKHPRPARLRRRTWEERTGSTRFVS